MAGGDAFARRSPTSMRNGRTLSVLRRQKAISETAPSEGIGRAL
jgi:hypothetical protein